MPPCGRCREFISELHDDNLDTEVIVAEGVILTLRELLPYDWRKPAGYRKMILDYFSYTRVCRNPPNFAKVII